MKSGFAQWAILGVVCMGLAAPVPAAPLQAAPLPAEVPSSATGPNEGAAAQNAPGHSPLNSRDEVWRTQPARPGFYRDIPRREGDYRSWQAGGPGQRPGGDWPGRPHGQGNGWGGGPQLRPGQRIDGFAERHWKIPYHGQDYFYSGGYWYRPYGNAYVVVTPPYGLQVDGLPDYAQEVWLNGQPLFIVAGVYYQYLPDIGQYRVVDPAAMQPQPVPLPAPQPSPAPRPMPGPVPQPSTGAAPAIDVEPLYGQGAQQQQQDGAHCYQWAVSQSGFDPANAPYAPAQSVWQAYQQALGTCLQERGYRLQPR